MFSIELVVPAALLATNWLRAAWVLKLLST
jgi:hypothetical protein